MKSITKRNFLVFYTIVLTVLVGFFVRGWACAQFFGIDTYICSHNFVDSITWLFYGGVTIVALGFPALLTLPSPPQVFRNWLRFLVWVAPLIVGVSWYLLSTNTDGDIGGLIESMIIGYAVLGLYALYFAISLTIIIVTWYKTRT